MYRFSVWLLKSCENYQNNRNSAHDDFTPLSEMAIQTRKYDSVI